MREWSRGEIIGLIALLVAIVAAIAAIAVIPLTWVRTTLTISLLVITFSAAILIVVHSIKTRAKSKPKPELVNPSPPGTAPFHETSQNNKASTSLIESVKPEISEGNAHEKSSASAPSLEPVKPPSVNSGDNQILSLSKQATARPISANSPEKFLFQVRQCNLVQRTLDCDLIVTNLGINRYLRIEKKEKSGETTLLDEFGNKYNPTEILYENNPEIDSDDFLFLSGVPTGIKMRFQGLSPGVTKVALLNLCCLHRNKEESSSKVRVCFGFEVALRNIPIRKSLPE